jgi:hypothetical protein
MIKVIARSYYTSWIDDRWEEVGIDNEEFYSYTLYRRVMPPFVVDSEWKEL